MTPESVAAHVRDRSGMDVQAVTLVRSGSTEATGPRVWAAMTEHGHFWAVENEESLELFRAVVRPTSPDDLLSCHSAVEAARRFLLLHPADQTPLMPQDSPVPQRMSGESSEVCQVCGTSFTRRRQRDLTRSLCPRCRHAERERLRYQQDPSYRARRLAYSAARYRQSQQSEGPGE